MYPIAIRMEFLFRYTKQVSVLPVRHLSNWLPSTSLSSGPVLSTQSGSQRDALITSSLVTHVGRGLLNLNTGSSLVFSTAAHK